MNLALLMLLYFLAVMRVTRLINYDTVMDWLHSWAGGRFGPGSRVVEFLVCPWCIGMWVALFTAWTPMCFVSTAAWAYPILYAMIALGASMVTGLMAPLSSEDTDFEDTDTDA